MPEYFDISLIIRKTKTSKGRISRCLIDQFGLSEGRNNVKYFRNREVLVNYINDDGRDFEEVSLGFPEQVFHRDAFESELEIFTSFVNICFECCEDLQYAICSYELNGYLLGTITKLENFNEQLLKKFPIVYKRELAQNLPSRYLNLKAQEILT